MNMKMKNNLLVAAILTTIAFTPTFAQDRKAGIKGGLNVSNLYLDDVDDENARIGFHVGVFGEIFSTETFAVQAELLYSTKGTKAVGNGILYDEADFNLNYLDVPVFAVFKLGESVDLHLGAYGAYLLGANISTKGNFGNSNDELDKDNFKAFDYGLMGGIGFNFGAIQVGARYNYGLGKIADGDTAKTILNDSKNSFGQVYVAFNLIPE